MSVTHRHHPPARAENATAGATVPELSFPPHRKNNFQKGVLKNGHSFHPVQAESTAAGGY